VLYGKARRRLADTMASIARSRRLGRVLPRHRQNSGDCMRKSFVVLFLTITLIFQSLSPVHAQFFGLGSTEVTQLLNHAELVSQYIRQGLQLQEALKQTADMIENSKLFTSQVFGPIMSDINALSDIVQ